MLSATLTRRTLAPSVTPITLRFGLNLVVFVDRERNYLIHYPDSLVNITFITSTSPCLRRALLTERYRGV
jgi:hypothetical protein